MPYPFSSSPFLSKIFFLRSPLVLQFCNMATFFNAFLPFFSEIFSFQFLSFLSILFPFLAIMYSSDSNSLTVSDQSVLVGDYGKVSEEGGLKPYVLVVLFLDIDGAQTRVGTAVVCG